MHHHLAYAERRECTNRLRTNIFRIASVIALLLAAGWLERGRLSRRLNLLESQRLCLNYDETGSVVYDGCPDSANARILIDRGLVGSYDQAMRPAACFTPLEDWCHLPAHGPRATLFLHRRLTPSGKTRLVAVETEGFPKIRVTVLEPGGLLFPPRVCPQGDAATQPDENSSAYRLLDGASAFRDGPRFLGGTADPVDRSHFTLPLVVRNRLVQIDGWLLDSETVKLDFNLSEVHKALAGPGHGS